MSFRDLLTERVARAKIALEVEKIDQLERYFDLLQRWNRTINLTALPLDPVTETAIDRLFVEPLAAAHFIATSPLVPQSGPQSRCPRWIDLGSGGGSPAIPMKIALQELELLMVESRSRKAAFLNEVIRALDLSRTRVENVRFEALAMDTHSAGFITARAVRGGAALEAVAQRFLQPAGWLMQFGAPALSDSASFSPVATVQLIEGDSTAVLQISAFVPRGTQTR